MPTRSAGLLLWRDAAGGPEVLLGHPGGPFFAKKDDGAWSVLKGELEPDEDPLIVARREFEEETGSPPPVGELVYPGRGAAAQREDGARLGGAGRSRPGHRRVEHVRDGVAAPFGPTGAVPRDRPGRVVRPRRGPGEAQPGAGRLHRPTRRSSPSFASPTPRLTERPRGNRSPVKPCRCSSALAVTVALSACAKAGAPTAYEKTAADAASAEVAAARTGAARGASG